MQLSADLEFDFETPIGKIKEISSSQTKKSHRAGSLQEIQRAGPKEDSRVQENNRWSCPIH